MLVLNNPHDVESVNFCKYLDEQGVKYCRLDWYSCNNHQKQAWEALRLVQMYLDGSMEGFTQPPPPIDYSEEEINSQDFPNEHQRWIMGNCCDKHKNFGYEGPPPRAFPSCVIELENGELGLWDCPKTLEDLVPEMMVCSVEKGKVLAGQWIEGAKATAFSPHYGNNIMVESVRRYIKKYETIDLTEPEKQLVTIKKRNLTQEERHLD